MPDPGELTDYPKPVGRLVLLIAAMILIQLAVHLFMLTTEIFAYLVNGDPVSMAKMYPGLADPYMTGYVVFAASALVGCVAWFHWLDRTIKNLIADGVTSFDRTPLQLVLAYMIPGWNLYRPIMDLEALYGAVRLGNSWRRAPPAQIFRLWWLVSLIQLVLIGYELFNGFSVVTVFSSTFSVGTSILALFVLQRFGQVQRYWSPPTEDAGGTMPGNVGAST